MRSPRNKTLNLSEEAERALSERCLTVTAPVSAADVTDRVILGDTFAVAPHLPRGSVDLLIADPPYNLTKAYHGTPFHRRAEDEYRAFTERWLDAVTPLLTPTASLYVCCDWRSGLIIGDLLAERFHLRNRITWQREKGRGAAQNWKNGMEDIYFATVSDDYTFCLDAVKVRRRVLAPYRENGAPKDWQETPEGRFRDTCPSNFWDDLTVPYWSMPENTEHPAQKPEKLIAKLILASSREGDLVLDPFLGSGTTAVTAKKLGRHFVGIEQNERYAAWAQARLDRAETDRAIQGYEDGIFYSRNEPPTSRSRKKPENAENC